MKQRLVRLTAIAIGATFITATANGQEAEVWNSKSRNGGEQITITRKSDSTDKLIIVLDGEKVIVNGKEVDEKNDDVTVNRRKVRDVSAFNFTPGGRFSINSDASPNIAMLGVTSSATDKGIKLLSVTKESGAAKAGLKKDDVITKIDNDEVSTPDGLTRKIRAHKPGDKIDISYLREGKAMKATAELGHMEAMTITGFGSNDNFNMNFDNNTFRTLTDAQLDRIPQVYGQLGSMNGAPKLGLTVQDTDDGKGVKVLNVSDEGNAAKAGLEEEDVILEVDGKSVNSADEIAKVMRDSKDKVSVKFKYDRDGKTSSVDVKVPRRLKTANL